MSRLLFFKLETRARRLLTLQGLRQWSLAPCWPAKNTPKRLQSDATALSYFILKKIVLIWSVWLFLMCEVDVTQQNSVPALRLWQRLSASLAGRKKERNLCRAREHSLPWVAFAQPWILSWKCFLLWKRLRAAWKMTSLVFLTVFLQKSATFYAVLGPRPNSTWCSETIFLLASHKFERFVS